MARDTADLAFVGPERTARKGFRAKFTMALQLRLDPRTFTYTYGTDVCSTQVIGNA